MSNMYGQESEHTMLARNTIAILEQLIHAYTIKAYMPERTSTDVTTVDGFPSIPPKGGHGGGIEIADAEAHRQLGELKAQVRELSRFVAKHGKAIINDYRRGV